VRDQAADVAIPRAVPQLGETPSQGLPVAHEFLEAVEINSFVVASIVQTTLTSQSARRDFDQFASQLGQSDPPDTRMQAFAMGGSVDLETFRPRPASDKIPGALQCVWLVENTLQQRRER